MISGLINKELSESTVLPCYFLYGEESYVPEQFVRELESLMASPEAGEFHLIQYYLDDTRWMEIIDTAKAVAFLFSPWRLIVVRIPEKASEADKDNGRGNGKGKRLMTAAEEAVIRDYLNAPTPRTVMVVLFSGKVKKSHSLVRFFGSFPPSVVLSKEFKALKERGAGFWIDKWLSAMGKTLTAEGRARLFEIVGFDLQILENEIEKLAVYAGDRKVIDVNDVNEISGWIKSFEDWAINDALAAAGYEGCVVVLDKLFKNGFKAEQILSRIVNFLRDILMAKTWLEEKRDRKAIFAEIHPNVSEKFQSLYASKFEQFFSLIRRFSFADLRDMLEELTEVDRMIKSTDVPSQTALEGFLFGYCRRRNGGVR